jgi:hypothetical protein
MLHMLPPPIGYAYLYQAVDAIGRALRGPDWVSVRCQDELGHEVYTGSALVDSVIRTVAEACEAGKLAAAFQHVFKGADDLDRDVWRKPHWRNFFASGTTIVDQPRLLVNGEPNPSGEMLPCERKIFIRKDSLAAFVKELASPKAVTGHYPGDAALVEELRELAAQGMSKRKAAMQIAPRAEGGGTLESRADRLRNKA